MSDPDYQKALQEAERLTRLSDDALLEQLGLRVEDARNPGGEDRARQYSAAFAQDAADMLSMDDLKRVGERWWAKLEPELLKLVCTDNEELGRITGGKTVPQIAASLATAAAVSALAPPAWIIVATSILAAKISETGLDALCEVWQESVQAKGGATEAGPAAAGP